jgi:uncharacterized phage-associated protein
MRNIKFTFNSDKASAAILWLIQRNNGSMDKLKLVKLFFWADRAHLAEYGRPIIGGTYYAMDYGPVSSELLDYLNEAKCNTLPFRIEGQCKLIANKPCDEEWLSQSDLDVLDDIYKNYGHIDPFRLSEITHELKAYKKNEPTKGGRRCLSYEDFFLDLDDKAQKMLALIHEEQEAWADFA